MKCSEKLHETGILEIWIIVMKKPKVMGGKPGQGRQAQPRKNSLGGRKFAGVPEALLSRCTLFIKLLILLKLPTSHTDLPLLYCLINTIISGFV